MCQLGGTSVQKSKTEKTGPKNRLTEKKFKKIALVNQSRKKFQSLAQLWFEQFKNSVNRRLIELKLIF